MKHLLALLCCFLLCSFPGLAQKKSSKSAMSDQQFVDFAGQTDMVGANLGRLASTTTSSVNIKNYAQKLVTDEMNDFQELWKAVHSTNLHVPNVIDKEHDRAEIDPTQKLRGATFDRRFLNEMIEGDTKTINIYGKEATDSRTPALRSYAEEALPILRADLTKLKKLEKTKVVPVKKG